MKISCVSCGLCLEKKIAFFRRCVLFSFQNPVRSLRAWICSVCGRATIRLSLRTAHPPPATRWLSHPLGTSVSVSSEVLKSQDLFHNDGHVYLHHDNDKKDDCRGEHPPTRSYCVSEYEWPSWARTQNITKNAWLFLVWHFFQLKTICLTHVCFP